MPVFGSFLKQGLVAVVVGGAVAVGCVVAMDVTVAVGLTVAVGGGPATGGPATGGPGTGGSCSVLTSMWKFHNVCVNSVISEKT